MPKVRVEPEQPVRVQGQIFGAGAGQTVVVTLDRQCTWRGQLVPLRLETTTDGGGLFTLLLPPNAELATVDGQGNSPHLTLPTKSGV